jgi:hypothetical protein
MQSRSNVSVDFGERRLKLFLWRHDEMTRNLAISVEEKQKCVVVEGFGLKLSLLTGMSTERLRTSEHSERSARSSISDIPIITSPTLSATRLHPSEDGLRDSASLHSNTRESDGDLDIEDPLSRIYRTRDEFEPFSSVEKIFISASCVGIVAVPLIYVLVTKLSVSGFLRLQAN